jgi:eukaryotic-like serine/threonine-protein kinase
MFRKRRKSLSIRTGTALRARRLPLVTVIISSRATTHRFNGAESCLAEDEVENIGRYEIVEELGKGAMGLVYKAVDPNIGRTVALKTMRLDVHGLEHDELLRRFRNEARAAGTLSHPNIVTIYDAGEDKGVFYIAMELVEGRSLQELLNESRVIPVDRVLTITRQICLGLDYAHQHSVIHRDVKPANIMITADGTVKIMDFGIAKAGGGMTSTGQVLGTPNYMAPEQIKGKALDGRSDLFSVGVIVYEMLTGEKPFVGQNVTTIIYKICNEKPIPPRELDVSIHPGLSAVVTRALSKSPDDRYQTGADLVRDLENYKSIGSEAGTTQTFSTTIMQSMGDQTVVGSVSVPPAAPAPVLVPPRNPQTQAGIKAVPTFITASDSQAVPPPPPTTGSLPNPPTDSVGTKSRTPVYIGIGAIVLAVGSWFSIQNLRKSQVPEVPSAEKIEEAHKAAAMGMEIAQQAANIGKPSATQPETPAVPAIPNVGPSGELKITSEPTGATVQLDGNVLPGVTPIHLPAVKPGTHAIVVTHEGYTSLSRNFDLGAGKKKEVAIQLKPELAELNVATDPKDAAITVDGKHYGKSPQRLKLPVGEHTVVLQKDGFTQSEAKVTLSASQASNISEKLKPAEGGNQQKSGDANPFSKLKRFFGSRGASNDQGTLSVTTKPEGAHVTINGSNAPGTTPVHTPINSGTYKMTIRLDGYKTVERQIVVEKGKTTGIDEILLPK